MKVAFFSLYVPHFLQVKLSGVILAGIQTSEETPGSCVVSPPHIFKHSESRGGLNSDGFVEFARSRSIANSEMIGPPLYLNQGNDLFYPHELLWAEPSSLISQRNGLSSMPADDTSQNASSYGNDSKKAPFETPNHGGLFNFNGANHVIYNHHSSDENGRNKAQFETSNYGDTSCVLDYSLKQDSSDFIYPNCEDYPMPATGTESKKLSNTIMNEYGEVHGHIKVKKNIDFNISSVSVPRASNAADGAIYGGPSELSASENMKPSSKCSPLVSFDKYGLHSEDEIKDGILESRRALPSCSMAGGTTIKNSFVAARDWHSVLHVSENLGLLPTLSVKAENKTLKMETEVSDLNDSSLSKINNPEVQNNTFERGNIEDDSDLCVIEDMSAPAQSNRVATNVKLVTAKHNSTSSHPGTQIVTAHVKRRPNNERVIYRVALQVNL